MEEGKSKKIIIAVVLLAVAAGVTLIFNNPFTGRGASGVEDTLSMLCVNEKCGHAFEMTREDYNKQVGIGEFIEEEGPVGTKCPKCGEESAFVAQKCDKCGEIFISNPRDVYPDRCPKCGYSAIEEKRKGSARR